MALDFFAFKVFFKTIFFEIDIKASSTFAEVLALVSMYGIPIESASACACANVTT